MPTRMQPHRLLTALDESDGHLDEQQLADYFAGTLDEASRDVIADHLASCPTCADLALAFADFNDPPRPNDPVLLPKELALARQRTDRALDLERSSRAGLAPVIPIQTGRKRPDSSRWLAAAGLAAGLGAGLWLGPVLSRGELSITEATLVRAEALRGEETAASRPGAAEDRGADWVYLRLQVGNLDGQLLAGRRYRVVISARGSQSSQTHVVFERGGLRLEPGGNVLAVPVPAARLRGEGFEVALSEDRQGAQTIEVFPYPQREAAPS